MSAIKHQPGSPLPFRAQDDLVFLGEVAGGFNVQGCPNPEQLAAYIAHAANAYPKLVERMHRRIALLRAIVDRMPKQVRPLYEEALGADAASDEALLLDIGEDA